MATCLITQLKSAVSGDLDELGTISVDVKNANFVIARLGGADSEHPISVYLANGSIKNYSDVAVSNPYSSVGQTALKFYPNAATVLKIRDKYNLGYFKFDKYVLENNTLVNQGFFDGVIKSSWFIPCTKLSLFNLVFCDFVGSINDLGACIAINDLYLSAGKFEGDIVTLVKDWIANGRSTTGSVTCQFLFRDSDLYTSNDINLTFNGKAYNINMWSVGSLNWESATKIYLNISSSVVWCVGYSDAEITTNTGSGGIWEGKTVTKCD